MTCTDRASHRLIGTPTVAVVDNRAEVRDFLVSRRAKITPEQAGLPAAGQRRVPGLRRSEVAALAGVSVEYYSKLERGALAGVSAGVLDGIARALQLETAERSHLFHLAQSADGTSGLTRPRRGGSRRWTPRPGLRWTLDAITAVPAFVGNGRSDLVVANLLARALFSEMYADPTRPPNFARFIFLDSAARCFYPDWESMADATVSNMRTAAGRDPHDEGLHQLVGELATRSDEFRRRWSAHDVRIHGAGTKRFRHPIVGELVLAFETAELQAEHGLDLCICSAEPGSPSEHALALLASWAATEDVRSVGPD